MYWQEMYNTKDIQSLLEDMSVAMNGLVDRVSDSAPLIIQHGRFH